MVGIRRWYHGTGVKSTDNIQTVLNLTQRDNTTSEVRRSNLGTRH